MKIKIIHETFYKFEDEVFFEPHFLRLKPKMTPFHKLESFDLKLFPKPSRIIEQIDAENNLIHFCWFDEMRKELNIKSESLITVLDHNPFNFIIYPDAYLKLPFTYSENLKNALEPSLKVLIIDKSLVEYGNKVLFESHSSTLEFLTNLTRKIHDDFSIIYRHEGSPFNPDDTFNTKEGSCRDLAWMQIHILRNIGIAAKFVSGYYYFEVEKPEFELHAWVEVYLPGGGWIGFDPSHGIITGKTHIQLASSYNFSNTMTVTGYIRGDAASNLETKLSISTI